PTLFTHTHTLIPPCSHTHTHTLSQLLFYPDPTLFTQHSALTHTHTHTHTHPTHAAAPIFPCSPPVHSALCTHSHTHTHTHTHTACLPASEVWSRNRGSKWQRGAAPGGGEGVRWRPPD